MKRTVLIIGANSNIGSYLAEKYYQAGYRLILHTHKHKQRIDKLLNYEKVYHLEFDIRDYQATNHTINDFIKHNKIIPDILIITSTERSTDFTNLAETDINVCENIINTNVLGAYYILKCLIPFMRTNTLSHIVLFSSNVSRIGLAQGAMYAASKAALSNLVRSVAKEEGENGILINAVSPGPVKIDDKHFTDDYRQFREDYYAKQIESIPIKRLAEVEDIYYTINYLTSSDNRYISGEEIFITGGSL